MKRVLVTGATGFIGRVCIPRLVATGFDVHGVARTVPTAETSDVTWHACDLFDEQAVEQVVQKIRPSNCLHLAWTTTAGTFWSAEQNLDWTAASLKLATTFIEYGGTRLVVAGSCAEYMERATGCDENALSLSPHTLYGRCKHGLHLILDEFARQSGIQLAWGRIFYPYGPQQEASRLIPFIMRSLLSGERVTCHSPQQVCDWIHVEDVAEALVTLVTSEAGGGFNISTGVGHSVGEVVTRLAEKLERRDLLDLEGSLVHQNGDRIAWIGQSRRLQNECRWRPAFDLEHGLDQLVTQLRTSEANCI